MIHWRSATCILAIIFNLGVQRKPENCDVFRNLSAMIVDDHYNFKEVLLEGTNNLKDVVILQVVDQRIPKLCKHAFEAVPKLILIRLQDCRTTEIEVDVFGNAPSLRTISLSGNKIKRISKGVFRDLPVQVINLPENHIKRIEDDAFQNLPLLEEVNLSKNNLSEFNPNWFSNTPRLRRINLVYNNIEVIPEGAFGGVRRINNASYDLWFMNNNIRSIHVDAFNGVKYIGDLWLDNNNLTDLEAGVFRNVRKIHTLSLENNEITCLGDDFLNSLRVDVLMISGNPWNCDCLGRVLGWIEKNNVLCEVPKRFSGCSSNKSKAD